MLPTYALSSADVARIKSLLAKWHADRDAVLLGSQLGQLIGEVISPLTVRGCGGLKALVQSDLSELVVRISNPNVSDACYRILVPPANLLLSPPSTDSVSEEREIQGVELWRIFSNPRLSSRLAASQTGEIVVAPVDRTLSPGKNLLRKLTSEDYRLLASQFAATWSDTSARAQMLAALETPEFYNDWIAALRRSRTGELNPLRQWEITRAEHVARKLGEELVAAGVDIARAAEIVATARPSSSRGKRASSQIEFNPNDQPDNLDKLAPAPQSVTHDIKWMREMLHIAIEQMSLSDLLEIRVPAGVLLDISRQRRA